MIITRFAFAGTAAAALTLSLSACNSGNSDAVNTTEINATNENLNAAADSAASDAANAEAAALGAQEQQLQQENGVASANPTDADEQNVAGM